MKPFKTMTYVAHEYKSIPLTNKEIIKTKKDKRNETIKLILDLFICLIILPAIGGFFGWLLPLQYSIFIAILIGLFSFNWFVDRRQNT